MAGGHSNTVRLVIYTSMILKTIFTLLFVQVALIRNLHYTVNQNIFELKNGVGNIFLLKNFRRVDWTVTFCCSNN